MIIGVLKEIKNNENRVALTPAGVAALHAQGHRVIIESMAGMGSGFTNEEYVKAGAEIIATAAE
ncbi:MAG TPA: alanine dehydrogenase, partial [Exiguobacterium sp.]|nr:alanine dehydrogenase [Exiguobacterium sp.]